MPEIDDEGLERFTRDDIVMMIGHLKRKIKDEQENIKRHRKLIKEMEVYL